jgi:hypothetical protein
MSTSWWRKLLFTKPVRRTSRLKLWVEPLEHRDTPAIYAAAVGVGSPPVVAVYDAATHQQVLSITAYDTSFTGGVNVALGDVNGDGTPDVVTGAGAGGGPVVNVFSGKDGNLLTSYAVGDADSRAGVTVAAADFDGDGKAEVVAGSIQNGNPLVQVLDGMTGTAVKSFTPFAGASGVSVAVGDVNGDGTPDVVAGAGTGGGPEVTVLDGKTGAVLLDEFAFEDTFRGGVFVSAGDVDGDGKADVTAGAGVGGGPRVVVLSGSNGEMIRSFYAYDATARNGVQATVYVDGTGSPELVTVEGTGNTSTIQAFNSTTLATVTLSQPMAGLPAGPVALATTGTTTTTTGGTDAGATTGSSGDTTSGTGGDTTTGGGSTTTATDASGMTDTMPATDDPNWIASPDGLKTWDVQVGTGDAITSSSTVSVYYTGWLAADGTQFETNTTSTPASFPLSGLIQGWQEGLVGMQAGGIRRLYIPAALAYGETGSGSKIPPNADLVFEIKVLSVG